MNNLAKSTNDGNSDDEENDGTTCKICKISSIEVTEKFGDWIECDTCDEYICPKCYDKRDIFADDDSSKRPLGHLIVLRYQLLLEIDQAQLKNSNYDILFSSWLVSMEICPKGIFMSIWHLPVQVKIHKQNIRTKRETLEAYSEPCQTSKMKLFAKYLTAFSY